MVPVDIYLTGDSAPTPIAGASVAVFDLSAHLLDLQVTDVQGKASFLLDAGTYEVRMFKLGVLLGAPKRIAVLDPATQPNEFVVTGTIFDVMYPALDPRCCHCGGRFMNFENKPVANALVRIMAIAESGLQIPKIVDGNMVSAEAMEYRTDANGWLHADLLRGGQYYITFTGEDDHVWYITVPDRALCNLIDLIHPYPALVLWGVDSAIPLNVPVGQKIDVPVSVQFSDFIVRNKDLLAWIQFTLTDGSVGNISYDSVAGNLQIEGLVPGSSSLIVSARENLLPKRVPPLSNLTPPLLIQVS